jgi:hypothetical protein
MPSARSALLLAFGLLFAVVAEATDNGSFGVGILVRGSGYFLNPIIKAVVITESASQNP